MGTYTLKDLPDEGTKFARVITWVLTQADPVGQAIPIIEYQDRTVQVEGTFGAGGTGFFKGSNDAVNFHTLRDPLGVFLIYSAPDVRQVLEATAWVRPELTSGDGTTSLTVTLFMRKTR